MRYFCSLALPFPLLRRNVISKSSFAMEEFHFRKTNVADCQDKFPIRQEKKSASGKSIFQARTDVCFNLLFRILDYKNHRRSVGWSAVVALRFASTCTRARTHRIRVYRIHTKIVFHSRVAARSPLCEEEVGECGPPTSTRGGPPGDPADGR